MSKTKQNTLKYHDPLCYYCRGTGRDFGSDGMDGAFIRDGNPVLSCLICKGTGENTEKS